MRWLYVGNFSMLFDDVHVRARASHDLRTSMEAQAKHYSNIWSANSWITCAYIIDTAVALPVILFNCKCDGKHQQHTATSNKTNTHVTSVYVRVMWRGIDHVWMMCDVGDTAFTFDQTIKWEKRLGWTMRNRLYFHSFDLRLDAYFIRTNKFESISLRTRRITEWTTVHHRSIRKMKMCKQSTLRRTDIFSQFWISMKSIAMCTNPRNFKEFYLHRCTHSKIVSNYSIYE